eukprot:4711255-Amphidinium_carterae.1
MCIRDRETRRFSQCTQESTRSMGQNAAEQGSSQGPIVFRIAREASTCTLRAIAVESRVRWTLRTRLTEVYVAPYSGEGKCGVQTTT